MYTPELKKDAESGNKDAQFKLAVCYSQGQGIAQNLAEAFKYFQMAAKNGHAEAMNNIGVCYQYALGIEKDEREAFRCYQTAALRGSINAQNNLASCYENGTGITKNLTLAFRCLEFAAKNNHLESQYKVACYYKDGIGVPINKTEAFRYFQMAADKGHVSAQYFCGIFFANGTGVAENASEAFRYFKMSADQENANAQYEVGLRYQNGLGVVADEREAVKYLERAATQGDELALHNLSIRYHTGRGVKKNKDKAISLQKQATNVFEKNLPVQLLEHTDKEKILLDSPSLLLHILEETSDETEKSLAEIIFSHDVDYEKSHVLAEPPIAEPQRGPTCGLYALKAGLKDGPPARKNDLKPTIKEKKETESIISLRHVAKEKYGSITGEIFDVSSLKKIANHFGFAAEMIKDPTKNLENYINTILKYIKAGNYVVLPAAVNNEFPAASQELHYVLAWGFIFKNNQYYFLVTQHGKHHLWSAEAVGASHAQMAPESSKTSKQYYKDRLRDSYFLNNSEQKIAAEDLRIIPVASLEDFKWSALALPVFNKTTISPAVVGLFKKGNSSNEAEIIETPAAKKLVQSNNTPSV